MRVNLSSNEESAYDRLLRKYTKSYYPRSAKDKLEVDIARLVEKGKSREQAINEIAAGELVEPSLVSEDKKKLEYSVDYLHEKIADERAKQIICWIGALAGGLALVAGFAVYFYSITSFRGEIGAPFLRIGFIVIAIGVFILILSAASVRGPTEEKEKYLKELEKSQMPRNICPNCGRDMSSEFRMCPYCGTKLESR